MYMGPGLSPRVGLADMYRLMYRPYTVLADYERMQMKESFSNTFEQHCVKFEINCQTTNIASKPSHILINKATFKSAQAQ